MTRVSVGLSFEVESDVDFSLDEAEDAIASYYQDWKREQKPFAEVNVPRTTGEDNIQVRVRLVHKTDRFQRDDMIEPRL